MIIFLECIGQGLAHSKNSQRDGQFSRSEGWQRFFWGGRKMDCAFHPMAGTLRPLPMWGSPEIWSRDLDTVLKGSGALQDSSAPAGCVPGSQGPRSSSHLRQGTRHPGLGLGLGSLQARPIFQSSSPLPPRALISRGLSHSGPQAAGLFFLPLVAYPVLSLAT